MYRAVLCLTGFACALAHVAAAQSLQEPSAEQRFVEFLLTDVAKASSCRDEYDPASAVSMFEIGFGKHRKWSEMDTREPDIENHMMEWIFPGFSLVTSTHFSYYGPSTWLHSLRLSAHSESTTNIGFGQTVAQFSNHLGIPEKSIRSNDLSYEGANVTIEVATDDTIRSIYLECVAD